MQRMTMPNFCINFLNKAAKLLSISYDFAVAPSSDAWIKTFLDKDSTAAVRRTLLGCVD